MDIYSGEGESHALDIEKAKRSLAASSAITGESLRRANVAEITAAALLDIAYSLRSMGAEAAMAMNAAVASPIEVGDPASEADDLILVGDRVTIVNDSEVGVVTRVLVTEGELAADVDFESSGVIRLFQRHLVRVARSSAPAVSDEDGAAFRDDDFGDDFDQAPPATALDMLRATEAAEKPKRKKATS